MNHTKSQFLQLVDICVLVSGLDFGRKFERLVSQLVDSEILLIQLRDKHASDRQLMHAAHIMNSISRPAGTRWIINDRADLVRPLCADGVHLGQEDWRQVQTPLEPEWIVGISTHNLEQLHRAFEQGADYVGVGPTFPSTTKSFDQFAGLEFCRQAHRHARIPAFAIGGIDATNVQQVAQAGLHQVAVSGVIVDARDVEEAVQSLRSAMRDATNETQTKH